jgi:hypothetical protein
MTHSIHITNTQLTDGHVPTQMAQLQSDSAAARGRVPRSHVASGSVSVARYPKLVPNVFGLYESVVVFYGSFWCTNKIHFLTPLLEHT